MRSALAPDRRSPRSETPRAVIRRRRAAALAAILIAVGGLASVLLLPRGGSGAAQGQGILTLMIPGTGSVRLTEARARLIAAGRRPLPVPSERVLARGEAEITYRLDRGAARRDLVATVAGEGGDVAVAERPVASTIAAPVVKQVYPNNCETAALQMLLASRGIEQSQRSLQRRLRRDGPLDPRTAADGSKVWGDPDHGFVGRVEGGGVAGGYGVYPKPLIALASRWVDAIDLSGGGAAVIYKQLLSGHAVLAWIGLSAGPYETWRGPRGERVRVNWGEHTVLLRGLREGRLVVNDPLIGERVIWSKQEFEEKWALLGHRAISA